MISRSGLPCRSLTKQRRATSIRQGRLLVPAQTHIAIFARYTERPTARPQSIDLCGFPLISSGGRIRIIYDAITPDPTKQELCTARQTGFVDIVALEKHHLSIDLGVIFALNGDGSFSSKGEFSANASSRIRANWTGMVDVRYDYLAAVQQTTGTSSTPGTTESFRPSNPFQSGGGTFDSSITALLHPGQTQWELPWWAFVGGLGIRTQPAASNTSVTARGRVYVGGRIQVVGYNPGDPANSLANTRGFFQIGYAYDRFWEYTCASSSSSTSCQSVDSPNRLIAAGQLEIPGVGTKTVRVLALARLDWPLGGTTPGSPTEFSLSVLAAINPTFFQNLLGGGGAKRPFGAKRIDTFEKCSLKGGEPFWVES